MAKQVAPVSLTGGLGFYFEDCVAGRFLIDMLAGLQSFGPEFGLVSHLDWQTRDTGRLLDDLMVTLNTKESAHRVEFSIKSNRQVTGSGFPKNFVESVWEEWLHTESTAFDPKHDLLILVVGELGNEVNEAWTKLLRESIATTSDRMVGRLTPAVTNHSSVDAIDYKTNTDEGSQSSETERNLFNSLHCPTLLQDGDNTSEQTTIEVIRRVRLLRYDFLSTTSQDEARAIADCQKLLVSGNSEEAIKLWQLIVQIAAEQRGKGGSLVLAGLLDKLRYSFKLAVHPCYRSDLKALVRVTDETMRDVQLTVGGEIHLDRIGEIQALSDFLATSGICFAAGDSGCGKSALAKEVQKNFGCFVALSPDLFEKGTHLSVEQSIGLSHPLVDILVNCHERCLLLFDSLENYSDGGIRLAGKIIAELQNNEHAKHVNVLITVQIEASARVVNLLSDSGVERALLELVPILNPSNDQIQTVLDSIPGLPWGTLHQDLRPVLRNLKILDWVVRSAQEGGRMNHDAVTGLITLIDYLWMRWAESDSQDLASANVIKKIATIEATKLSSGVATSSLEHSELTSLPRLMTKGILNRRNEQVRFSHGLVGDWARLKVFIGEDPTSSEARITRASVASWHRAVRLYGRWVLTQPNGGQRWIDALNRVGDTTTERIVVRDLLLESIIVADESKEWIGSVWPQLIADDARLLKILLKRFMFVATVPDLRVRKLLDFAKISPEVEAEFRFPIGLYWTGVLSAFGDHSNDVCRLVPEDAARICKMWLEKTPIKSTLETPFPYRLEVSRLAMQIADDVFLKHAERNDVKSGLARIAYEVALLSANEFPDEVSQFALEVARRRPYSQHYLEAVARADNAKKDSWTQLERSDPERAKMLSELSTPVFPQGPLADPWPDGPSDRVDDDFGGAILNSTCLYPLIELRPLVASEVLLAVCIEAPKHEDLFGGLDLVDDFGVNSWHKGYPPLYFRGPFLRLLRVSPAHGIDFVLRLVNFATKRWLHQEVRNRELRVPNVYFREDANQTSVEVRINDEWKTWLGDRQVYNWHMGYMDCKIVACALMALEKWIYEQIESGSDVNEWLNKMVEQSESVAFAAILINVGKHSPDRFVSPLTPLLGVTEFYFWDRRNRVEHANISTGLVGWWNEPHELAKLAREWHKLPHREYDFQALVVWLMLHMPSIKLLFDSYRDRWRERSKGESEHDILFLLEQLDHRNYKHTPLPDGKSKVEYVLPKYMENIAKSKSKESGDSMRLVTFSIDCRLVLDGEKKIAIEDIDGFWNTLISISNQVCSDDDIVRKSDCVAGGIAVLIGRFSKWLDEHEANKRWVLTRINGFISDPPKYRNFDHPNSSGDWGWECFLSECGVYLLASDPDSEQAKQIVANGVVSYHYGTTARTMSLAFQHRSKIQQNFALMQAMAISWASIRYRCDAVRDFITNDQRFTNSEEIPKAEKSVELVAQELSQSLQVEIKELISRFIDGSLPSIDIATTNVDGVAKLDQLEKAGIKIWRHRKNRHSEESHFRGRTKMHREEVGIDLAVLKASFSWLDISKAESVQDRKNVLSHIQDLLGIMLGRFSLATENDAQAVADSFEFEGLPNDFDGWLLGIVAKTIVQMHEQEMPENLWRPILELSDAAHVWTERFFWYWFEDGSLQTPSMEVFVVRWRDMIRFALGSNVWDPSKNDASLLGDRVYELLGYHLGQKYISGNQHLASLIEGMWTEFELVFEKWFKLPKICGGFTQSLAGPGYEKILCRGIKYIHSAMKNHKESSFRRQSDFNMHLVSVLDRCLREYPSEVTSDDELKDAISSLLTGLVSYGNNAAMVIRDRFVSLIASPSE